MSVSLFAEDIHVRILHQNIFLSRNILGLIFFKVLFITIVSEVYNYNGILITYDNDNRFSKFEFMTELIIRSQLMFAHQGKTGRMSEILALDKRYHI